MAHFLFQRLEGFKLLLAFASAPLSGFLVLDSVRFEKMVLRQLLTVGSLLFMASAL